MRLLIVDNQRGVRRSLRATLESIGQDFDILEAGSGEEALLAFARHTASVDLLVTDLRLAGISGLDLAERLRQRNPALKVILTGNGFDDRVRQQALQAHVNALITRPVESGEFIEAIQRCLDSTEGPASVIALPAPQSLDERLERIRQEMSALAVILLDASGQTVAQASEISMSATLKSILPALLEALAANARLAQALGGDSPDDLLCQAGSKVDLYAAHVSKANALLVLFDGGTVGNTRAKAARLVSSAVQELGLVLPESGSTLPTPDGPPDQDASLDHNDIQTAPLDDSSADVTDLETILHQAATLRLAPKDVDDFWETALQQQDDDSGERRVGGDSPGQFPSLL